MSLLRRGYWHDWLVLFAVTVVVGGALAGGIAWGVDTLFGDVVNGIVGDVGEYDVLVQWNAADDTAISDEVAAWVTRRYPGAELQSGPTVGNQAYFFIKFPPEARHEQTFNQLDETLGQVPGYAGYTVLIEPSLVINQIHEAVIGDVLTWAGGHPDIDFSFRQRSNLVIVLNDPQAVAAVQRELDTLLRASNIIDVRPAPGETFADAAQVEAIVHKAAADVWPQSTVQAYGSTDGAAGQMVSLMSTLQALQALLATENGEAAAQVQALLPGTDAAADDAVAAWTHLVPLLVQLKKSVEQIAAVDAQLTQINNAVAALNGKAGGSPLQALLGGFDVSTITALLDTIMYGMGDATMTDAAAVSDALQQLATDLPLLNDGAVTAAMQAIEQYADVQAGGERITVTAPPGADAGQLRRLLATEHSEVNWRVQPTIAGIVAPNARLALAQVLGQFRSLVAALITVIVVIVFYVFDQSIVISANKTIVPIAGGTEGKQSGFWFNVLAGTVLGWAVAGLSGASLPLIGAIGWLLIGLLGGSITWAWAHRFSPVDASEVVAGTSFGLSEVQLMRHIIVPQARPGLLAMLNRHYCRSSRLKPQSSSL